MSCGGWEWERFTVSRISIFSLQKEKKQVLIFETLEFTLYSIRLMISLGTLLGYLHIIGDYNIDY